MKPSPALVPPRSYKQSMASSWHRGTGKDGKCWVYISTWREGGEVASKQILQAAEILGGFRATSTAAVDFGSALSLSVAFWVWSLMTSISNCFQLGLGNASLPVTELELNWTLGLNTELAAVLQTLSGWYCN